MSEVTLSEMLDARERRAHTQKRLLFQYSCTLLSFTMNIAGPIKNSPRIRQGFLLGKRLLKERLRALRIQPVHWEEVNEKTGNEAYILFDTDARVIKEITAAMEEETRLGRLFDLDVLTADGEKVDRTELGLPGRRCLLCERSAKECARSRAHSVPQLQKRTEEILEVAIEDAMATEAASFAVRALLYEVGTTPKPGLVDRYNSGSHKDMDIFTFFNSSAALYPYFEACTRIGRRTAGLLPTETFLEIRKAGKKAEADMFAATAGINTHKGAVFSMGILCAALGRLPREDWGCSERVLEECAALTEGLVAADFADLTPETAKTVGQRLYLSHGITGVRGQMEAGLPAVQQVGLPVLREGLRRGLSLNEAGCATLLALITATKDTNLIARSDLATWQAVVEELKELLLHTPYPDTATLLELDRSFMEKNLSPGGSADLLAICYMLYFCSEEKEDD